MSKLNTAIVGLGQTEFSKDAGRSEWHMACESITAALDDAGLTPADVDGMCTFSMDKVEDVELTASLGIENLRYSSRVGHGGGGACGIFTHAAAAIQSGLAEVVVVYRSIRSRSGKRFGGPTQSNDAGAGTGTSFLEWSMPFGALSPGNWSAMNLQRYMDVYGVTNEDVGRVSVTMRKHAATNPAAWYYQRPITLEEQQASRWIIEPTLRRADCCQESDGSVAMVLTTEARAKDLKQVPVRVSATSQAVPKAVEVVTNYYHGELSQFKEAQYLGRELYRQTGFGPKDFQVAMLYDHFAPIVLMQLEAFGFCDYGEAKDFVKDGHIELAGSIPVNPNGGLIGEAYIHGVNNAAEAVRQVRGTSVNQVDDVENVLVSAGMSGAIFSAM
ncbi:lipid-transfer protein [Pseudomaricurvus alkylphenolicus]|uniref:thiolase C-terminal domain-containing protein n=1 Tax=Pseudomaricurvus alkylphenolicus TaxID=1306991 RepID=UPI00142418E5|nr:lipid-transfer protein [Pseudomaricurvus alkylphenolicus]NIB38010.1 lipid-transfer protein [Pseudomaricurvus alkylphenolicus]